jgi:hypothetical protein
MLQGGFSLNAPDNKELARLFKQLILKGKGCETEFKKILQIEFKKLVEEKVEEVGCHS